MGHSHHHHKNQHSTPAEQVAKASHEAQTSQGSQTQYTSHGAIPAPLPGFETPGPTASERAFGPAEQDERMDAAAQSVKSPLPKTQDPSTGTAMSPAQAPTVEEVFDPKRPALKGGSQDMVLKIIQDRVDDLYQVVLIGQLPALKTKLSKTAPVPETPFAMKMLA